MRRGKGVASGWGGRGDAPSYADVVKAARSPASLIGREEGELMQNRGVAEEDVTGCERKMCR